MKVGACRNTKGSAIDKKIQNKLLSIPDKPGVYLFRDEKDKVLYVGKAKVLKNRIRSYFQKSSALDERKSVMIKNVHDFEFTVTENELEALVLEANLIKQHRPRYNILLRDDKSYPYLKLTINEKWPRLEVVRRIRRDGARYFGPYVPSGPMWTTVSFIRNAYHIPTCKYSLEKRIRPCIQLQIKKCIAPCTGEVKHNEYMSMIHEITELLEGRNKDLIDSLKRKMEQLSEEIRYEEAAIFRDRIRAIKSISESQKIIAPELGDIDIIGLYGKETFVAFKLLLIRNGIMTGSRDFHLKNVVGEPDEYALKNFLEQFYAQEIIPPPTIACSVLPADSITVSEWLSEKRGAAVKIVCPRRGIKRKILMMAEENAEIIASVRESGDSSKILRELKQRLGLPRIPESIGAFDISNISGKEAVGAFIYWENGNFLKTCYRHIKMKAASGPDDYSMMREMISKTIESFEKQMPDLILVDGGREHLNAALKAIKDHDLFGKMVISLAKEPDRVFLENRKEPLDIEDGNPSSLLLKRIRDEVHRFAISYHKKLRTERLFESPLDRIYGIGRRKRMELLNYFGSIEAVKKASADEIAKLRGFNLKLAEDVLKSLNKTNKI